MPKEALTPLLLRGFFGFSSNICGVAAMRMIPLAKATVLFYTNPIFIGILGYIFLKETVTPFDMVGIGATFLGVVIFTMNPFSSGSEPTLIDEGESWADFIGTIVAIMGAAQAAAAMLCIRKVGGRTHFLILGLVWGFANSLFSPLFMFALPFSGGNTSITADDGLLINDGPLMTVYGLYEIRHVTVIGIAIVFF